MTLSIRNKFLYKEGVKLQKPHPSLYIETYLRFLGFNETLETIKSKYPYTIKVLRAYYDTLYLKKDVELDEDVLHFSLREVGRMQDENNRKLIPSYGKK